MGLLITAYNAICNLGLNIDEIYTKAICETDSYFEEELNILNNKPLRLAKIKTNLPEIKDRNYNTRCNRLILAVIKLLEKELEDLFKKYSKNEIGVIVATTNSGIEEYETSKNDLHFELGNPSQFVRKYLNIGYNLTVSTACSSGIRAFSIARNLISNNLLKSVLVVGVDSIAKLPLYGFDSLEILNKNKTNPFSKNYTGINIGEAVSAFILENGEDDKINILGIGETTDTYHATTPDPSAKEAINAINKALKDANLNSEDIDYINLHGTGTIANDSMEALAISKLFNSTPASSTKPMTGHCLGASACIETALICHLINNFKGKLFPHAFDGIYNENIEKINLVKKNDIFKRCRICMNNSFGFGGTNAILILGKKYEKHTDF